MAKHREWDQEVTIYVWRYLSNTHVGHTSIKLRGFPDGDAYISWWPHRDERGAFYSKVEAQPVISYKKDMVNELKDTAQDAIRNGSPLRDKQRLCYSETVGLNRVPMYGREADYKIKLPGVCNQGVLFGLDMGKMLDWWKIFCKCPHPKYKMASKHTSCTGVAAAALKIGGAEQFIKAPTATFFIDPNQMAKWANELKFEIELRNDAARRLAVEIEGVVDTTPAPQVLPELMTVAQWTTLSNQNMGGAKLRSDKVQKIDRLMKDYHAQQWSRETQDRKWRKLGEIMDTVHSYLIHKVGSKRGDSVLKLGKDVLAVAKYKAMEYMKRDKSDAWAW